MTDDFEMTRKFLSELADVIQKFKSEAVQLLIVEHLLSERPFGTQQRVDHDDPKITTRRKKSKSKGKLRDSSGGPSEKKGKAKTTNGPLAVLKTLVTEGFFKKSQTIGQIGEHCKNSLARPMKSNELSPYLIALTRQKVLKRSKNAENQYEYIKA